MPDYKFTVVVEQDEDGLYVASVPLLQGCYTQGETYEEALENIRDAIKLHIEARRASGEPVPIEVTNLSQSEVEVLQLVAQGATNKQIADTLFISENVVKTHLRNIIDKLHLANRSQIEVTVDEVQVVA